MLANPAAQSVKQKGRTAFMSRQHSLGGGGLGSGAAVGATVAAAITACT